MVFCSSHDRVRAHALKDAQNKHNIWLFEDLITQSIQDKKVLVNNPTRFNQFKIWVIIPQIEHIQKIFKICFKLISSFFFNSF